MTAQLGQKEEIRLHKYVRDAPWTQFAIKCDDVIKKKKKERKQAEEAVG